MIIKKKNNKQKEQEDIKQESKSSSSIIKAGSVKKPNPLKQKALEKKEKQIALNEKNMPEPKQPALQEPKKTPLEKTLEEYEKIDVTALEFKERYERRRGERRRGFRRIDERALVSRAHEEAQSIRELAAQEGYKNGLSQAQDVVEELKTSLESFLGAKEAVYEEVSGHIIEIALAVAKKIIKKEVEASNEVLKAVLGEVLDELNESDEKVTVKVNPEDVEFARASLPEILSEKGISAKINVAADELIQKGSCTLAASNGVVDANFSTQLAIIQNAFGIYEGGE